MLTRQLALDLAPAPPPTLENFVPGRNAEVLAGLRQALATGAAERFIYIWGAPGSGRTHLLRGAVAAALAAGATARYVDAAAALPNHDEEVDFVAVDDVERLGAEAQVALFALYNALRERHGALLASGNAPPVQLGLRPDLVTRLGWGLVYQVHALSDEEKVRALKRRAAERGFELAEDVCAYLLTRARRDMPSLLALLDALDRYSLEAKRPVTVALVRELLRAERDASSAKFAES